MIGERLQVGCDLDDVVFMVAQPILDDYLESHGVEVPLTGYYSTDPTVWGVLEFDEAVERVNLFLQSERFFDIEPTQETVEVVNRLAISHDLHAITGRPSSLLLNTIGQLEKHLPDVFKSVTCTNYNAGSVTKKSKVDKGMVCEDLGIDVMIDDLAHHALVVAKRGIQVILFGDNPYNKVEDLPHNVTPAPGGWPQVEEILAEWPN